MFFEDIKYILCFICSFYGHSKGLLAVSRRKKQYQFWLDYNSLRWPADLVSFGQVEATNNCKICIVTCSLQNIKYTGPTKFTKKNKNIILDLRLL